MPDNTACLTCTNVAYEAMYQLAKSCMDMAAKGQPCAHSKLTLLHKSQVSACNRWVMLSQSELLTGPHWDPAGGEFPESTFAADHLALEHPWECCMLDKHSAREHRQTPGHATTSQPSEHSSWGLHIHSLLLYKSCKQTVGELVVVRQPTASCYVG